MHRRHFLVVLVLLFISPALVVSGAEPPASPIVSHLDLAAGALTLRIGGQEAFVYRFGESVDLPHIYPLRSPSGRPMTVQQTEPYPHHRSFWFADKVELAGQRVVGFYDALYSRVKKDDPAAPFRDRIRSLPPGSVSVEGTQACWSTDLVWEMDLGQTPVLDEHRDTRLVALGGGEYFLDITFTLKASYGDVAFRSDAVHYAWPYLRMNSTYSVEGGGTITNSEGGVNQAGTNMKPARWVDYSNTVDGRAEGLAVFSHPQNGYPHAWLTRDYGTFGPRRVDARSGKPFTLARGETLTQRVGVLVHRGDVEAGQVAERYRKYVEGKL